MKEHKKDVKFGCNLKVKLNNRGASLSELMVAMGASMLVLSMVSVVMNMGIHEFRLIYEQNQALDSLERAATQLRIYTQNGVNVRGVTCALCGAGAANQDANATFGIPKNQPGPDPSTGYMGGMTLANGNAGFDQALLSLGNQRNGTSYPIAVFLSEAGGYPVNTNPGNGATQGSFLRPVAIWYQTPNVGFAGELASGIIYLSVNSFSPATPNASIIYFPRMSYFRMEVVPAPADPVNPNGPAWQVIYDIRVRYFLGGEKTNWFYDPLTPGNDCVNPNPCPIPVAFKESNRQIRVGLRNNALSNSQIAAQGAIERAQGSIYYYKTSLPIQGQFIIGL